jgi:hypothetical protein
MEIDDVIEHHPDHHVVRDNPLPAKEPAELYRPEFGKQIVETVRVHRPARQFRASL